MELPPKRTMRRRHVLGTARYLTFSCYRRLRLFDNDRIKDHFVARLSAALARHGVATVAWVVMPEHVHLILFCDADERVARAVAAAKHATSCDVLAHWREVNAAVLPRLRDRHGDHHFWQSGGG